MSRRCGVLQIASTNPSVYVVLDECNRSSDGSAVESLMQATASMSRSVPVAFTCNPAFSKVSIRPNTSSNSVCSGLLILMGNPLFMLHFHCCCPLLVAMLHCCSLLVATLLLLLYSLCHTAAALSSQAIFALFAQSLGTGVLTSERDRNTTAQFWRSRQEQSILQ